MSDAYQPYISEHLLLVGLQTSYTDMVEVVMSCSKVGEKKKHYSKLTQALASLTRYNPDKGLVENLLPYLSYNEKSIQALAYYHINALAPSPRIDIFASVITNELGDKSTIGRKVFALRTFPRLLVPEHPTKSKLNDNIKNFLKKDDPGKKAKKDQQKTKLLLQYSAAYALRHSFINEISVFHDLFDCLTVEDGLVVRHSMASILLFIQNSSSVKEIATQFYTCRLFVHLQNDRLKANFYDTFTRVYFTRMCAILAYHPDVGPDLKDAYYEALCHLVNDVSIKVSLEAILGLTKGTWKQLSVMAIAQPESNEFLIPSTDRQVLQNVLNRLSDYLLTVGKKSMPIVHSSIRILTKLAHTFVSSLNYDDEIEEHPFFSIFTPLKTLLANSSTIIRLNILKSFVWIMHDTKRTDEVVELMLQEMKNGSLSLSMTNQLLSEWLIRLKAFSKTSISSILLDILEKWIALKPENVPVESLYDIWVVLEQHSSHLVGNHLLRVINQHHTPGNRMATEIIHRNACHFLAIHATNHISKPRSSGPSENDRFDLLSIILVLEQTCANSSHITKQVCLESLVRIAIDSEDSIKNHVCEFLQVSTIESTLDPGRQFLALLKKCTSDGRDQAIAQLRGCFVV